ncbi:unnamed protein product [Oncorhynchus mykiss]|uniref:PH domain-containing protein n=1 Tax=Oncorhynchus mykiss TaxID=8022 RepID=A0A060XBU6_ONCMY|nr:unnamed protein product [Oncorhynchus mykiss]
MENHAAELLQQQQSYEDVRKSGYLRKQKSMHRRFFVLREASEEGPARLEYYENEKKFRSKSPVPKKALNLETCFNINKRADSKNKHMIVMYTRGESFAIAADSEDVQNEWYQAMLDLQWKCKNPEDCGSGGECGLPSPPGPTFKEVWQVKVWPKGLGQARNLVGIHRLCLTDKTVNFVKLNSDVAAVVLQLMNVRRCGHSENFFFIEVGRSAMTGPGEFWMQVEDSVVAQNMHETLLEAMKALSEEFRQRSKSQSVGATGGGGTASNPISVPTRRHHPNLPPSQVGFGRRARTETPGAGGANCTSTSPTPRHGFPRARTASIGGRTEEGGVSVSGSPSDYGSSDEYGSSPGEHSLLVPSLPGGSNGGMGHHAHVEGSSSYIRRLLSKRASLPLTAHECLAPRRKEEEEDTNQEYAVMSRRGGGPVDSGYMSMLPGPGADDEYMAMTPNSSVSPPQHISLPVSEGYMVMSPNSSCSPDMHGMAIWGSRGSMESRAGSDYMNMSPISIRSACSTPPSQPEQNPLQHKMVYSYFSLPRSYKHTLSTRFEDDLDQGKRKEGGHSDQDSAGNRGGQVGYSKRDTATVGPAGGSRSKDGSYQQKRVSHGPGGQQRKPRPLSVSVDMSKANTLPRVKENLFPTEPQSPGEYVSIVFRGGDVGGRRGGQWGPEHGLSVTHGTQRPRHRPALCHGGSTNLPRSFSAPLATSAALAASTEYVNMDLGLGNSPCPSTGTPVKSPFCPPPAIGPKPPVVARNRPSARAAEGIVGGHRAAVPTDLPTSYTNYTEMAFSIVSEPNPAAPAMHAAQASSMEQESGLDFPSARSYSSPDQNQSSRLARDRVGRGDQLGRRRHRSETFIITPPPLPLQLSSSGSLFLDSAQAAAPHRQGGLERGSPWENAQSDAVASQASSSGSAKQGLNYIDLDLAFNKDSSQNELEGGATAPHNIFAPVHNGAGGGVMMGDITGLGNNPGYASIDFFKSEERRALHQSSRKDGKGKVTQHLFSLCVITQTHTNGYDLEMLLTKPLLCCPGGVFGIIVMLKDPATFHLQCPC